MAAKETVTGQQLLIAGKWVDASSGKTHDVISSYTGEVATRQAAASTRDVDAAVEAAAAAFPGWSSTAAVERRRILDKAGELLAERAEEIAATVAAETGGTFGWAMFNVTVAASFYHSAGEQAEKVYDDQIATEVPGLDSRAMRQPLGVVAGIAPWNAPVILGARAVVWALAFGNTVVMKASEQCPRTHAQIVAALVDAGIPDGVVNLITNDPADAAAVVETLIRHPVVRHVNFTGSTKVGRIVAALAADELKRSLLELGGKAPLVVLDDADLDAAAAAASFGAFMNSGQICMSTERIVADKSVTAELVEKLAARADALITGDPADPETQIGPVVNDGAAKHIAALIADAKKRGATIVAGGDAEGTMLQPTVISGVTPEMRIYAEESFGPVVAIVEVDGDQEAIDAANDTEYGLAAAVFGKDVTRALAVASKIESGICHVNGATVHDEAPAPFGGVKHSGWGRFGAGQVRHEFTDVRWITISEEQRHYPI